MDVGTPPTMGQLIPVVYSPKNPDKWGFAPTRAARTPAATDLSSRTNRRARC